MASSDGWEDVPVDQQWEDVPVGPAEFEKANPSFNATGTAALHFARHGLAGLGDKAIAAIQAGRDVLADKTGKQTFGGAYDRNLALSDAMAEAGDKAHPAARWLGNAAGVLGNVAMLGAAGVGEAGEGATLAQRANLGARVGAGLGAAGGFGASRANDAATSLGDTLKGAGAGAFLGGFLPVAAEGGSMAAAPVANAIRETALNQGRRVLTNGADSLSTRQPVRDAAVESAIREGAIRPFGNTHGTFLRLQDAVERQDAIRQGVIDELHGLGVQGPAAHAVADRLMRRAMEIEPNEMNPAVVNHYLDEAQQVLTKAPEGGSLTLPQAERLKSTLTRDAKYDRTTSSAVNDARRGAAAVFRQANEDAVEQAGQTAGEGSRVRALADQFVPVKQRTGNLIEALNAAERGNARGMQRGHFGLKETVHAAGAVAAGHPGLAPVVGIASSLLKNRVPSAVASYGLRLSDALGRQPGTLAGLDALLSPELSDALGYSQGAPAATADNENLDKQRALAMALRKEAK